MEKIVSILNKYNDCIDYEKETGLLTNGVIDSVGLVTVVAELEEAFQIDIPLDEMVPENFDSVKDIWGMIIRLKQSVN